MCGFELIGNYGIPQASPCRQPQTGLLPGHLTDSFPISCSFLKNVNFECNFVVVNKLYDNSTICAVSTPPGSGGIAVIRLSGGMAVSVAETLFVPRSAGKKLSGLKAPALLTGTLRDGEETIDEVVVALFRGPHSYTGEDVVEISCHGSLFIQQRILSLLVQNGAKLAGPGEFTQRAFLNRKLDLSQAEAVADLVASVTEASHRVALNQMRGGFSGEIRHLRHQLLSFTALVELELDFSEEDVEFADRTSLQELVKTMGFEISGLIESFRLGNAIRNGIPVAIVGDTNVGKSTLLNALLREEKAIVSPIHGTTRDVIEDVVNIHGTAFRFFDTAGLRHATGTIEQMGQARTLHKLREADIVLLVVDLSRPVSLIEVRIGLVRNQLTNQQLIIVANKTDRQQPLTASALRKMELLPNEELVFISAREKTNLDELVGLMQKNLFQGTTGRNEVVVTNVRHFEALTHAREALLRVEDGLEKRIPGDLLAQDIRECLHYLGQITGDITDDEILGHIFKNFCIGK